MSDTLVQIDGAPRPPMDPREIARIAVNLAVVCALSAVVLGGVFMGTDRYQKAATLARERRAVIDMLALGGDARVLEVKQFLAPEKREVVYRVKPYGDEAAPVREVVFTLEGALRSTNPAAPAAVPASLVSLGRLFVARQAGQPAGFVIEGESRGYKNRIRFFVALDTAFTVQGVRVVEHEEDPGLGAEVATPWFQGQFVGRTADRVVQAEVAKLPMPEDWRAALNGLATEPAGAWRAKNAALISREAGQPIYAVTGATISSRALTRGVRTTVDHFRRRWALLAPQLGGQS
jgi:Na+-translocating ferredoxin:NAD+ oxidoreductase subunit G